MAITILPSPNGDEHSHYDYYRNQLALSCVFAPTDERYEALYASDDTGLYGGYAQAMQHCTHQMMPQKTKMLLRSQAVQHWHDRRWYALA